MKKVLIIDDSKFIQTVVENEISKVVDVKITICDTYEKTKKLLKKKKFDIAIVDLNLPDAQDGEAIDLVLAHDIPTIVLTGGMNKKTKDIVLKKDIIEFLKGGLNDAIKNKLIGCSKQDFLKEYFRVLA